MKKILLTLAGCIFSWISMSAAVGEHIRFSIYQNSADSAHQYRIRLKTDTDAYWDGTAHAMTLYQVAMRFPDGVTFRISNTGLPFTSGILELLPATDDPADTAYSLQRVYYGEGATSPWGNAWATETEYDLAILTVTSGTPGGEIWLVNDNAQKTGNYAYTELDSADYMTDYSAPFYGDTSSPSGWEYGGLPGEPLPVNLADFTAAAENKTDVRLRWETAMETNNRGFYIERSQDGETWKEIRFVPSLVPGGSSQAITGYGHLDSDILSKPGTSTWYYRLRQEDINGEYEYVGGIRAVHASSETMAATLRVYPNPASGIINLDVQGQAPARYILMDMSGKSVLTGAHSRTIDVSGLRKGTYLISVFDMAGARMGTERIIVAN